MEPGNDQAELLTTTEVAAIFKVRAQSVRAWIRSGKLPVIRFGGIQRIPAQAVISIVGPIPRSNIAAALKPPLSAPVAEAIGKMADALRPSLPAGLDTQSLAAAVKLPSPRRRRVSGGKNQGR